MVTCIFKSSDSSETLGPFHSLELRGNQIVPAGSTTPLALYQSGAWRRANTAYLIIECNSIIALHLEDTQRRATTVIGPRHNVHLRGAHLFAGREIVAKLSSRLQRWVRADTQESWDVVRVVPLDRTQQPKAPDL